MSADNGRGIGEFPDVVIAGTHAVETGLDALTYILDLGKPKVNFCCNACYIETLDI